MTDAPGALSPLDEAGINAAVEEALAAFATAGTLAELKEARLAHTCLLYTSPSPRDATLSRMPSSA